MIYAFLDLDLFITSANYVLFVHIYTYHIIFAITFQGWTESLHNRKSSDASKSRDIREVPI